IVENNADVRIGQSVVVYGSGGVGLNIVQAAALVSAYPVIAVDLYDGKLELAKRMGATHVINANGRALDDIRVDIQRVLDQTGSHIGADVFIDNTGVPAVIEMGYAMTKPQGTVTLVGVPRKGNNVNLFSLPLHFGK